jgi:hypothetical protein
MPDSVPHRFWHAVADWWSFQMGTIEGWLFPPLEAAD